MTVEETVLEKVKVLPMNRKQEVLDFVEFLESKEAVKRPRRSLKGALADLDINLSEEDMREARNEMWRGYTKDTDDEK
ncbi:MAG: DUF2281 domain-containing protein [Acidobacteriota bacterium]|nr:DUF2281 domain-containing protein [Acidobacteriota bacterium]